MLRRGNRPALVWPVIWLGGLLLGAGLGWFFFARPKPDIVSLPAAGQVSPPPLGLLPGDAPRRPATAGEPAPDFTFRDLTGAEVSLSDFTGQPVLVNVWASWCVPCQDELPLLQQLSVEHPGLVILGVNLTAQDTLADVKAMVDKFDLTFPILLDESGQIGGLYQVQGLPTSFFIDAQGVIRRVQVGALLPEYAEETLADILPGE
jgi:peroxiredoxin